MFRLMIPALVCVIWCARVDCARILGVYSMPSISHQVVFRALTLELAERGHELVVLTPNPALPKERPPDNITEIDTSESYQVMLNFINESDGNKLLKRGVIADMSSMSMEDFTKSMAALVLYQFDLPVVQNFLDDKTQKFDLVIVEAILNYPLIVGQIFKAPVIQFSSYYGSSENYDMIGAPAWHTLYYPNTYRSKHGKLSLWEKIYETYTEWRFYRANKGTEKLENDLLKKRYGPDAPTVADLQRSVDMVFFNAHPIIAGNRPVPPNVVYLGGLHIQPLKDLPQDIQSYLDNSERGVIYVSLGTNVRPSMMDRDFLEAFLEAFEALPFDILWKFDGDKLDNIPKNVKMQKWFPQRDLLMHPNVKLFVMQGGLQSTDEAIEAAVPLVGIPILGDQWYNVNKYVELGVGVHIDSATMTAADLVNGVNKVLGNDSYKRNMERLRAMIHDQPQTPLERAVWWTEHVLRHGGGQHLRAPSANKTWSEYYMLDVVAVVVGAAITTVVFIVVICHKILKSLRTIKVKSKLS